MKAHCIFCGKDFFDLDSFESHLKKHKELSDKDRKAYISETKRDIQKQFEAVKRKKEAKLYRKLLNKKKRNKRKSSRKYYYDSTTCSIHAILIASGNKR